MKLSSIHTCVVALALIASGTATSTSAHHSFAMFDKNTRSTVEGTVFKFEWTNPHVFIIVDVPDNEGNRKRYTIESGSVSLLMRAGWKPSTLKPGDRISVDFYPLRNGDTGGLLEGVTLAVGRVFMG
jgi:hypothetical protein